MGIFRYQQQQRSRAGFSEATTYAEIFLTGKRMYKQFKKLQFICIYWICINISTQLCGPQTFHSVTEDKSFFKVGPLGLYTPGMAPDVEICSCCPQWEKMVRKQRGQWKSTCGVKEQLLVQLLISVSAARQRQWDYRCSRRYSKQALGPKINFLSSNMYLRAQNAISLLCG